MASRGGTSCYDAAVNVTSFEVFVPPRVLVEGTAPELGEGRIHIGPGAAAAVLRTVDDDHDSGEKWGSWDSYLGVGGETRAFAVVPGTDDTDAVEDRPKVRGLFTLGFVVERMVFSGL